jgi:hypothetical protein
MRSILILFLICAAANLHAAVVTFEDVTPTPSCGFGEPVPCLDSIATAQGFVFSHTGRDDFAEIYVASGGPDGNYITTNFPPETGASIKIEHNSGTAFALHSIDVWVPGESQAYYIDYVDVSGYDEEDNLAVSMSFTSLPGGWVNLEFDDSWSSVHSVIVGDHGFSTGGFGSFYLPPQLDNFSASVVPIPAAVWLFGSALAGLGWLRRKQTV